MAGTGNAGDGSGDENTGSGEEGTSEKIGGKINWKLLGVVFLAVFVIIAALVAIMRKKIFG